LDLVVLARSAADTMDNAQITSELVQLWSDLEKKAIAK
jgi:RNase P protein component